MFPFDLPAESILALLVPIILVLYAAFLLKLKPAKENEIRPDKLPTRTAKVMVETQTGKSPTASVEVRKVPREESAPASQIQLTSSVRARLTSTRKGQPMTSIGVDASTTPDVQDAKKKPPSLLDEDFEGCHHYLGHLNKLPKSTPIPNECFGCPESALNEKQWFLTCFCNKILYQTCNKPVFLVFSEFQYTQHHF
jgi:hypothetical protein